MDSIDNEIKMLESRLAELKKAKNESKLSKKKNNFKILIYKENYDIDDIVKELESFDELKNYWEKSCKLKDTDKVILDFFRNHTYEGYEATINNGKINEDEFENLIKVISTLDAYQIIAMEFAICNSRDSLRAMAYVRNDKLNEFGEFFDKSKLANLKDRMSEEEYWALVDESKKFRLFEEN